MVGILVLAVVAATTGGVILDVLIGAVPPVHWSSGVVGESLGLPSTVTTLAGVVICLRVRPGSLYRGWQLPRVTTPKSADPDPRSR